MKIYYSAASPYVRKCMVVASELGLTDRIEKLACAASPVKMDLTVAASNPLGKVPALITDDGQALFDSRVICEYLNHLGQGKLFPDASGERWQALTEQSLADGLLDAALLARYETATRPAQHQWKDWTDGQMRKIANALGHFEAVVTQRAGQVDIGMITLGCALGYLDLRFSDYDWRSAYPGVANWYAEFSQRPSMQETIPHG
ncbi:glutathione S-transferase [Allopusillimonas ginsengisoli]|uniref:glutathione S-transferase n=1 Tax=Allopusillimonas ginsengisoli TaxID=453575 RepID=UPI0010227CFA|nr:glutathione S-transferase [Allopusillimonas ginsengisoli]TEA77504.1 glutathione S-transferase [Allopusillimonas ginsengisoli]